LRVIPKGWGTYPSRNEGFPDGAFSGQHSAKDLFFLVFADSRQLLADRSHRKTAVFGWALRQSNGVKAAKEDLRKV
jgi:hypothetical protein